MKKIIAALDGLKYSESTTRYAVYAAARAGAHLVGIFLDDLTYHSYKIYELVSEEGASLGKMRRLEEKDEEARVAAVDHFERACREAGLHYTVHHDRNIAIQELLHESVYADLLVIDSKETLTHYEEKRPTRFIRDLLADAQCPVLLVPPSFTPVEKAVLLYDGEPSSVFAIRMFSYMFPLWEGGKTELLAVNPVHKGLHMPDNRLMKEFMKRHFPGAAYTVLRGIPETEIVRHLEASPEHALVVLGAYRRGTVSRWLRASLADTLMDSLELPLFIAHNK